MHLYSITYTGIEILLASWVSRKFQWKGQLMGYLKCLPFKTKSSHCYLPRPNSHISHPIVAPSLASM